MTRFALPDFSSIALGALVTLGTLGALATLGAFGALAGCDAADASADRPGPALHAAALDPAALTAHKLGGDSMAEMALLASPDGRDLLSSAVSCALPRGTSFTAIARDGTPYSFAGQIGLAPAWPQRAATATERVRLTLCLRAHGLGSLQT